MNRVYQHNKDYDRKFKSDDYSCQYYSKKLMKSAYPDKGYAVIGAIGNGLDKKAGMFILEGKEIPYFKMNYSTIRYGIDGYIDCGNDQCIAVIKDCLIQRIILIILSLLIIIGLIFGGAFLLKDNIGLDPNISDYDPKIEMPANADPSRISIPGYTDMRMLADTDELYIALWNPETNPCYFKFSIILEQGEKVLYESGLVPPGKAITTVKLKEKMSEGVYPVLVKMDTFSLEDGKTPLNGGTSKASLTVIKE